MFIQTILSMVAVLFFAIMISIESGRVLKVKSLIWVFLCMPYWK
ncbi:MAG: hypothetical protein AAB397_02715 [Patescibacteria group bacterium]